MLCAGYPAACVRMCASKSGGGGSPMCGPSVSSLVLCFVAFVRICVQFVVDSAKLRIKSEKVDA